MTTQRTASRRAATPAGPSAGHFPSRGRRVARAVRHALASAGATAWLAAAAGAQQPDTLSAPLPLPEIRISVLRTPLLLLEAPYAVSVVAGPELRRGRPGLALDETLRLVPGLQIDNRYNYAVGERIAVRGFGVRSPFGVRGVRVLVDGIPATMPDGQTSLDHVDPARIARAEVVRGPAASVHGNAAGGVIQLESVPPPGVPLGSEARFLAGSHGLQRLESSFGGRVGATSWQFAGSRLETSGHRTHADARSARFSGQLEHLTAAGLTRLVVHAADNEARNPGSLTAAEVAEDRTQASPLNVQRATGKSGQHAQLGALWRRETRAGRVELAAHGVSRSVENPITVRVIELDRLAGGTRATLSAASSRRLRWTVGGEADAQRDDRRNYINAEGQRGELVLDQRERVAGAAAFADAIVPAGRLSALAGIRYDRFRFAVDDRFVAGDPDDSGSRVMSALSPSLGISVVAGRGRVYANLATAFETPTTTELANRPDGAGGFNRDLEPQRTRSAELGAKGRLGSGGYYELAVYRAAVTDQLIPYQVPEAAGRDFFRNAGSSLHRGIEAGLVLDRAAPGPRARISYTRTDARFQEYVTGGEDFGGNRVPGVAPHRLEAALSWHGRRWFAGLDTRWSSRMPVDDANLFHSAAYAVLDARLGLSDVSAGWGRVSPFIGVSNLLDAAYDASVVVNAAARRFHEPAPGRTLHAGVAVRFGG
jgi:iron complex outermembrane recepter protein